MTETFGFDLAETLRLPALVRAYVPVPRQASRPRQRRPRSAEASDWTLIFDTETTVDAGQAMRIGAYQLRKGSLLIEEGLFRDGNLLTENENTLLAKVAAERGLPLMLREKFIEEVFFAKAYELRATIVGFNLPFDISRIACRHNSARGKTFGDGGFTFQLSSNPKRAHARVKHLNSKAALIQFAQEPRQRTPRGQRKRGFKVGVRRGTFVDVKTLAAALLGRSYSLSTLAKTLQTPTVKEASEEHGKRLTRRYVEYLLDDVQATWECLEALRCKFAEHGISHTPVHRLLSEASVGKAYLREMNVRPFLQVQPDFPDDLLGLIFSTYYGGRSEVRWRGEIKQVLYCDFLSMYPTVCTLMGLWQFVISNGLEPRETTEETQAFLQCVCLADLQSPDTWRQLHTIVQLKPHEDILPLRARYDRISPTIGLNFISSDEALWYTLADVIAAKLLSGKTPRIESAITFQPEAPQSGLRPTKIGGAAIEPLKDDFYKSLVDLRSIAKSKIPSVTGPEKPALDASQLALKIIANATSYGIFVEVNVGNLDQPQSRTVYGPNGAAFAVKTDKSEEPGPFFNPLVATLITGAARLMLATAERLTAGAGLDWAFCDTDSLAIAKPDRMTSEEFLDTARSVTRWFDRLNPYEKPGPLFKIEDENFGLGENSGKLHPLFCLCLSSKRYALFNRDDENRPVIRKVSAHGLGHLLAPYPDKNAPSLIPSPKIPLSDIGADRWQYDLWYQVIAAAIAGHPKEVDLAFHPTMQLPSVSRYGATRPSILRWFDEYNRGRPYPEQVKPFGFLSALQMEFFLPVFGEEAGRSRQRKQPLRPIAPFDKDPRKAATQAFDRITGVRIPMKALKSYQAALANFALSPEAKFLNGQPFDIGRTERRHIHVTGLIHIGKEANKWEEHLNLGVDEDGQLDYGRSNYADVDARLKHFCEEFGEREAARRLDVSRETLRKALRLGSEKMSAQVRFQLHRI